MRRHRTDLMSLIFGLFFLAVVSIWAGTTYLRWRIDWNPPNLGWFLAGGLILLGVLGLLASIRRQPAEQRAVPTSSPARPSAAPTSAPSSGAPPQPTPGSTTGSTTGPGDDLVT